MDVVELLILVHPSLPEGLNQVVGPQKHFKLIKEDSFHLLLLLGERGEVVRKIDSAAAPIFALTGDDVFYE